MGLTSYVIDFARGNADFVLQAAATAAACGASVYFALRRWSPRVLWWALTAACTIGILAVTLRPAGGYAQSGASCVVHGIDLEFFMASDMPGNVVLFVPLGLSAMLASRSPSLAIVCGAALSALIEAAQAVLTGIGRECDSSDWLMNTLGAVLGAALARLYCTRIEPRRNRSMPARHR
ncbi:VanZ family protein [Streptomyces lavendulae]|uniref:VanZ family protein n=1 Tax=Streptomyces lavendulae TaxID=1914 RepID=UPI0037F804FC